MDQYTPANLEQRGGSVLTLDAGQGRFDGIVFGEMTPGKWMPGSEGALRTLREQANWPDETADGKTFVQMAIAYQDRQVTIYRNGRQYPDNDPWKKYEWEGGCEDLHIVEGEDGTHYMNYTTWDGGGDTMSVATSRDLIHWTKHGPAFRKGTPESVGGRSGVVISRLVGDRLIAAKINGKYWMYYTHPCALVWSDNLIDWTRADKAVWGGGHEAGAIALLRAKDIVLMFNTRGWGNGWTLGQALIDRNDLTTVLKHPDQPFLYPELEWEKRGFTEPAVVANTLVLFKGRWWLYYGAADRYIGLAVFTPKTNASFSLVN